MLSPNTSWWFSTLTGQPFRYACASGGLHPIRTAIGPAPCRQRGYGCGRGQVVSSVLARGKLSCWDCGSCRRCLSVRLGKEPSSIGRMDSIPPVSKRCSYSTRWPNQGLQQKSGHANNGCVRRNIVPLVRWLVRVSGLLVGKCFQAHRRTRNAEQSASADRPRE
jgi:hypothetical protein